MSGDGSVTFEWGDGEQRFRLGIGELRELQDKCDAGPFVIYQRLASGTWRVDDVRETLRLGLIGGGMDHNRALGKVGKYVAPTHFLANVLAARRIMLAALFGDPDDIVGKIEAGATEPTSPPLETEGSHFPTSSAPPPPSDGASTNSTELHFGSSPPPSMDGIPATAQRANGPSR